MSWPRWQQKREAKAVSYLHELSVPASAWCAPRVCQAPWACACCEEFRIGVDCAGEEQQEQEQQEQQQQQEQQEEEAAAAGSGGADGTAAVAAVVVEFQGKLDAAQQSWAAKLTTVVKTLQSHKEMVAAATTQATAAIDGLGRVDEAFTSVERVAVIVEALSTRVDLLDLCCSDLTRVDLLDQQVVMGAAAESFDAAPAMNLADSSPAREVSSSHHDGDGESGK